MHIRTRLSLAACLTLTLAVVACASEPAAQPPEADADPSPDGDALADAGDAVADAGDAQENKAPSGAPAPTVMLSQAWFERVDGKPKPGPARIEMWRQGKDGNWTMSRLHDPDSNVFHKAIWTDDGLLTIGAENANLKRWTRVDGTWKGETLWTNSWGGKFNRLRDIEIGDVDHDGKDEYVIASHDAGVVAVYNPGGEVIELDRKADTFVHEIEIGDIDGDGKMEFFATPSDRNQAGKSQHGMVVMYRWDGKTYQRSIVDPGEGTHAKEVLVADIDGDGTDELFSVQEAKLDANKQIVHPVEIRQYTARADGGFDFTAIAQITDRQTRFLVPGDFDGDGRQELVAAAMKTGLYLLDSSDGKTWTSRNFDSNSGGFEHAAYAKDVDGDGNLELYVAADTQAELKRYTWNSATGTFDRELLGKLDKGVFTWNIEVGML